MPSEPRRGAAALLALLAVAAMPGARAQEAPPPLPRPADPFTIEAHEDRDTISLQAEGADLLQILRVFSLTRRFNLVPARDVGGQVTVNLYDVPFEQALQIILDQNGLAYTREGRFYYIHAKGQRATYETLIEKLIPVSYLGEDELKRALESLRSQNGSFGYVKGLRSVLIRDSAERIVAMERLIRQLDVRPKQVLIEVTLIDAKLSDGMSLGINFAALGGIDFNELGLSSNLGSLDATSGSVTGELLEETLTIARTTGFQAAGSGFVFGVVKNNVAAFLDVVETVSDATVLANPKVVTLDGQSASIQVGGRLGYLTTTVSETTSTQSVSFLETGTQLSITPIIRPDGFIDLKLSPQLSSGSINALGLPEETVTTVNTQVLVRDGYTLVIGGLLQENASKAARQVPILGDIPIIGVLFRRQEQALARQELIFLITPHIIDPDAASHDALRARATFGEAQREFKDSMSLLMRNVRSDRALARAHGLARHGDRDGALCWTAYALHETPLHTGAHALRRGLREEERSSRLFERTEEEYRRAALDERRPGEAGGKR